MIYNTLNEHGTPKKSGAEIYLVFLLNGGMFERHFLTFKGFQMLSICIWILNINAPFDHGTGNEPALVVQS